MVRRCLPCAATSHRPNVFLEPCVKLPSKSHDQSHREESDPRFISNAADVKLRSFSTKVWAGTGISLGNERCTHRARV